MSSAQTTTGSNKRSLDEQRSGVDQLVKGLSGTGITRAAVPVTPQFSTKDFLKKSLYGNNQINRLQNVHSIFAAGLERRRRAALLGYGDDTVEGAERPVKRRRFQRRNSKTPAMLFKTLNILPKDLFDDMPAPKAKETPAAPTAKDDDEDWEGGLEIAEQLVAHLQKRRQSDASFSAH